MDFSGRQGFFSIKKTNNYFLLNTTAVKSFPVSLIKSMRSQPSAYRPHGCCGIGIPVFKIRVEYGAEKPLVLVIEQEEKAEELIDRVLKANPDITLEYYLSPHTGLKPEKISPPLY